MRRRGAKNRNQKASTRAETKIREGSGRKSAQKGPIWRRIGNGRFAETGWWCAQSYANPSQRRFHTGNRGNPLFSAFKCRSPAAAIERAKGLWKVFSHTGAVAFVR